jgi:predicted transcriptional regulator
MRVVSIKLRTDQFETLKQFAKVKNKTQSEIIREALREYYENHKYEVYYKNMPFVTKKIKIYV